jgi:hypothetical protein
MERRASRYGDSPITMSPDEIGLAIANVADIIKHANLHASKRPSAQE